MRDKQKFMDDSFLKFINSTGVLAKDVVADFPVFEQLSMLLPYLSKAELYKLKGMIVDLEEELSNTPVSVEDLKLQLASVERKLQ